MDNSGLIRLINEELTIELPEEISFEQLKEKLCAEINYLVQKDFQKLVSILYRVDVNETKLKNLLQEKQDKDAGEIIAELILERQLQKIKSRQQFRRENDISDDEKW